MDNKLNNTVCLQDGVECLVCGKVFMPKTSAITHVAKQLNIASSPEDYLRKGEDVVIHGLAGMDEANIIQGVVKCRAGNLIAVVNGTPSQEPSIQGKFQLFTVYQERR